MPISKTEKRNLARQTAEEQKAKKKAGRGSKSSAMATQSNKKAAKSPRRK